MRVESDQGLTNQDLKDGAILIGGVALLISTRGALRSGGKEIGRQLEEMKPDIPENASRFERMRFQLSRMNLRLIGKEAGKGAIDEIKRTVKGPEEKTPVTKPIQVNFRPQTLQQAA